MGKAFQAYIPAPLPPVPPVDLGAGLQKKFDNALIALGRLDALSTTLPDMEAFIHMQVRREAVASSMIEGTRSSLSDLLLHEMRQEPGVPLDDVQEVSNYVAALNHGLHLLRDGGLPISLRLFREVHRVLLSGRRGENRSPGEFRRSQNWIGGLRPENAAFVPPPADEVMNCMGRLELFLHDVPECTPVLVKAALAHVQLETIHPFLDGNGRLGRLLITFLLCAEGVLRQPSLCLSLYFKSHRQQYYRLLSDVSTSGDWEAWLDFFADAVLFAADQATDTAGSIADLADGDRRKIGTLGRTSSTVLQVHQALLRRPMATAGLLAEETGLAQATVNKALTHLQELAIVRETTSRRRDRLFCYGSCLDIFSRGMELPDS